MTREKPHVHAHWRGDVSRHRTASRVWGRGSRVKGEGRSGSPRKADAPGGLVRRQRSAEGSPPALCLRESHGCDSFRGQQERALSVRHLVGLGQSSPGKSLAGAPGAETSLRESPVTWKRHERAARGMHDRCDEGATLNRFHPRRRATGSMRRSAPALIESRTIESLRFTRPPSTFGWLSHPGAKNLGHGEATRRGWFAASF